MHSSIIISLPPFLLNLQMIFIVLLPLLLGFLLLWRQPPHRRRLPPGSMGWPYIGETLKLYTQHPSTFFSIRQKWYGKIFKSHLLGCPCVMISSPEAAKMVLVSKANLFKPIYPPSKQKMIGPQALFFHQGQYHSLLKKLVLSAFTPAAVRASAAAIQNIALNLLSKWENATSPICTLHQMKEYAFEVAMISAFGENPEPETQGIKRLYQVLEKGYNSMPLDFPGTLFHKAMKARKSLNEVLRKTIDNRRKIGKIDGGLLGILLGSQKQQNELSDCQIADNIIGVIFAAHDTTASVLTWVLKYLHDNVHVLEAVTREQEGLGHRLEEEDKRGLTWDDTRHMPLTSRVIQETLRSASILSFTFREAVEDVEFQGYVIPKGWKVLPLFRTIHHNSDFFPQPDKFDPSRFQVAPKRNTYMPFGNGAHSCPGSELAKLEMLILIHHLITTYRWKVIGDEDAIEYRPFPVPKGGLPIEVTPCKNN